MSATGVFLDMMLRGFLGYDEESNTLLFTGRIQCDGYSAYQKLARFFTGLSLASCLAHLRRKFFEAREQVPEDILPILLNIQEIYRVERKMKHSNSPPGCRELIRRARSLPLFDQLKTLIQTASDHRPLPASKLGKALTFTHNQWDKVKASALDPRLDLDTNRLENKIRPLKLGLKNYQFMGSADAGKDAALIYTLIENCKVHGIDPERYLVEVIEAFRDPAARERAAELTPAANAKSPRGRPTRQNCLTAPAENYPAWSSPDRMPNFKTLTNFSGEWRDFSGLRPGCWLIVPKEEAAFGIPKTAFGLPEEWGARSIRDCFFRDGRRLLDRYWS